MLQLTTRLWLLVSLVSKPTSRPTPVTDPVVSLLRAEYCAGSRNLVKGSSSVASAFLMALYVALVSLKSSSFRYRSLNCTEEKIISSCQCGGPNILDLLAIQVCSARDMQLNDHSMAGVVIN